MTRFAWLQSRTQSLAAGAALGALAIAAAITGVQLSHLSSNLLAGCRSGCDLGVAQLLSHDRFLQDALDLLALVAPALIGIFWGAPLLARELETGTYRLAWTQSVSRSHWLVTKLAIGGLTAAALAGALTLTVTWWYRAIDIVSTNQYAVFDRRDIAPVAYALFAFAWGALVGAVIRRTLPAMATILAVFVLVRVAVSLWVRPHLLSPLRMTASMLNGAGFGFLSRNGGPPVLVVKGLGPSNSWTLSSQLVTRSGHVASSSQLSAFLQQHCPGIGPPPQGSGIRAAPNPAAFEACRNHVAQAFHLLVSYQPASRYWTFQWLEAGIFLALALVAAAACYWWVTRRSA